MPIIPKIPSVSSLIQSNVPSVSSLIQSKISGTSTSFLSPSFPAVPSGPISLSPSFANIARLSGNIKGQIAINLQKPPVLLCEQITNFDFHKINDYFITLGTYPAQLQNQLTKLPGLIQNDLKKVTAAIKAAIDDSSAVFTKTLNKLHSLEHEMMYKAREFQKNIEHFFTNFILEKIKKLIDALKIPNPLNIPIPYLSGCVIGDMFTVSGRTKIKNAIFKLALQKALKPIIAFLSLFDISIAFAFNGRLGDNILEYQVEEVWHKVMLWVQSEINLFMQFAFSIALNAAATVGWTAAATAATAAGYIPLATACTAQVGVLNAAFASIAIDPTIVVEQALNAVFEAALSKALKNPIAEMNHIINEVLNFPIPFPLSFLTGADTMGQLIGINLQDETFKYKMHKTEMILIKVWDLFKQALERIKRLFVHYFYFTIVLGSFDEILEKLGKDLLDFVLSKIPILGTLYEAFNTLRDLFSGKFPACTAMLVIAPQMFALGSSIASLISNTKHYHFDFTPYGLLSREKQKLLGLLTNSVHVQISTA